MSYCINPYCLKPTDPLNLNNRICRHCGSQLLLLGRYKIISLLSEQSGFSRVYKAQDGDTEKIVKVLKETLNNQPKAIELFHKEAEVLSQLNHPGIPKIEPSGYFTFSPGSTGNNLNSSIQVLHCLIMEKIDGLNLEQWMKSRENKPITQQQAIVWLKQIAEILNQVHQQQFFHRDIKPSNIMLRPNGQLVLIDFGSVREVTGTYLGKVAGLSKVTKISSPGYTPPEQEKGYAVPQSDFYALGRTFVYLLTGKEPTEECIYDPYNDELDWRKYAPQISSQFADFIDYLMAPKAGNRPANIQVILQQLAQLEQGVISLSKLNPRPRPQIHRPQYLYQSLPSKPEQLEFKAKNKWFVSIIILFISLSGLASSEIVKYFESRSILKRAEVLAGQKYFYKAVLVAKQIRPDQVLYEQAQTAIARWQMDRQYTLERVKALVEQGNLQDAIQITKQIESEDRALYKEAQTALAHWKLSSYDLGVTLKVHLVHQAENTLELKVSLRNEGLKPVNFLYNLLNVTDDSGRAIIATTEGLPTKLPANGEEFFGTISLPKSLLNDAQKLTLTLSDYPEEKIYLKIFDIPVIK